MANNSVALTKAEQNALAVSYDVLGTRVELDLEFVKKYLVRGRAEAVSSQELVLFMNTCKMQKLNPLANGEVYLVKYAIDSPAQLVVGKYAYLRRAQDNPAYIEKEDGITVLRNSEVVQKQGCCLYPNETLIGGWCRVFFESHGEKRSEYKEVALSEYNKSQSTWKSMPATMINKVAVSQCVREAFPKDFEGLYSEDELVASGVILESDTDTNTKRIIDVEEADPIITEAQRKELFSRAKDFFGEKTNAVLKGILAEIGHNSTADLRESEYERVMARVNECIDKLINAENASEEGDEADV